MPSVTSRYACVISLSLAAKPEIISALPLLICPTFTSFF
jgi:hypothetical protein